MPRRESDLTNYTFDKVYKASPIGVLIPRAKNNRRFAARGKTTGDIEKRIGAAN